MMKYPVVIFTEGGQEKGFGHVVRCYALYQAFKKDERILDITLVCDADQELKLFFKSLDGLNVVYESWVNDINLALNRIPEQAIVVVDSYYAAQDWFDQLKITRPESILAVLDDYKRLDYKLDVLINGSLLDQDDCEYDNICSNYLVGKEYVILREEFWKVPTKEISLDIKDVVITLGGAIHPDVFNKIVSALSQKEYHLHCIVPQGFVLSDKENISLYQNLSAQEVKDLFVKCDVCISACGQTLYELSVCGVPTIGILVADNQKNNVKGFIREDVHRFVDYFENDAFENNLINEINFLSEISCRKELSIKAQSLIDGQGANRIVSCLIDCIDG